MKSVLIITGEAEHFGSGHIMRMRLVALELKKHKIPTQLVITGSETMPNIPLPYAVVILDRRDTGFNTPVLESRATRIAVDNRGLGRKQAELVADLLPHFSMNATEYKHALAQVLLSPAITQYPAATQMARIKLCEDRETAFLTADFPPQKERLSPHEFAARLHACERPALYFGQALFEALYLGKQVQLYPVSEYHEKLAVDLYSRTLIEPDLLSALDGQGLKRFTDLIISAWRKQNNED